jgi:gamma-glutamylcyclotransferase (GGCT)/AIG2-like uncharacterized protein YtfP
MTRLPLYVFGTLRRGEENHFYLDGKYDRVLPALLRGFRRSEPLMIVRDAAGQVDGELYFLRSDLYDAALRGCDDLEGIPPGQTAGPEYQRLEVRVETAEGTLSAWAYVHPDTLPG